MSFYSILFSLLLLESVKTLFSTALNWFKAPSVPAFCILSLSIMLFTAMASSVLFTVQYFETTKQPYSFHAKLVDLASFFTVALALVALNPTSGSILKINVQNEPFIYGLRLLLFWIGVSSYSFLLTYWNALVTRDPLSKKTADTQADFFVIARLFLIVSPLLGIILAAVYAITELTWLLQWISVLAWAIEGVVIDHIVRRQRHFDSTLQPNQPLDLPEP